MSQKEEEENGMNNKKLTSSLSEESVTADDFEANSHESKERKGEVFQSLSQTSEKEGASLDSSETVVSRSESKPPHLDMRKEGLISKFLGKDSIVFRGWKQDQQ